MRWSRRPSPCSPKDTFADRRPKPVLQGRAGPGGVVGEHNRLFHRLRACRSGDDRRRGPTGSRDDLRQGTRRGDQVGQGDLRIQIMFGRIGFETLDIDPQGGALGAGSRQPIDDARAVGEQDADALTGADRSIHRVGCRRNRRPWPTASPARLVPARPAMRWPRCAIKPSAARHLQPLIVMAGIIIAAELGPMRPQDLIPPTGGVRRGYSARTEPPTGHPFHAHGRNRCQSFPRRRGWRGRRPADCRRISSPSASHKAEYPAPRPPGPALGWSASNGRCRPIPWHSPAPVWHWRQARRDCPRG